MRFLMSAGDNVSVNQDVIFIAKVFKHCCLQSVFYTRGKMGVDCRSRSNIIRRHRLHLVQRRTGVHVGSPLVNSSCKPLVVF